MDILIVDDDSVVREHIKRILSKGKEKNNILESDSVNEAINIINDHPFDMILLDYKMPERDGIELLVELRENSFEPNVAIVMISDSEEDEVALNCINSGAQDFIIKSEITAQRLYRSMLHARTRFDLEQKLYRSYREVKEISEKDALTGLRNRFSFEEGFKFFLSDNHRSEFKVALIIFDLDHFKYINDTHGHDAGDLLLKELASRVSHLVREQELFARIGGDEFALVISHIKEEEFFPAINSLCKRILDVFKKPFDYMGEKINTSISMGIAVSPDNGVSPYDIFKFADIALYRSKKNGRNCMSFFENSMQDEFLQRYQIDNKIESGMKNDSFYLDYQPIFNAKTADVIGFESLIRWNCDGKILLPEKFIKPTEDSGFIVDMGSWVIDKTLENFSTWLAKNKKKCTVSINISVVQIRDKELTHVMATHLTKHNVEPKDVVIEITETVCANYNKSVVQRLKDIQSLGCLIALDGFSSNISPLSHLIDFPIDRVKVGEALLNQSQNEKGIDFLTGLTLMLHTLGLTVVAKRIETEESLKLCQNLGIDEVQGFHLSHPISAEQVQQRYF